MISAIKSLAGWKSYAAAAVAGAVLLSAALLGLRMYGKDQYVAGYEQAVLEQQSGVIDVLVETLQENERRMSAMEDAKDDAQKRAASAAGDAGRARAAYDGLLKRANSLADDARRDYPALAAGGPSAGSPIDMLAYMLSRLGSAAGELAEYGDSARNAGLTCEAVYDGVRGGQRQNRQQNIHENIPGVVGSR